MKAAIVLAVVLVLLVVYIKDDRKRYEAFKKLTETKDRQRTFRIWVLQSFLLFGVVAVVALAIMGRLNSIVEFPPEFQDVMSEDFLSFGSDADEQDRQTSLPLMLAIGLGIGLVIRMITSRRTKKVVVGDTESLLPKNGTERLWATLISINAGFSEEIFFRLMLPLLIYMVSGNALLAFIVAGVLFGLVHFYQGIGGVISTAFLGLVLTIFYLASKSIWVPILFHAAIDLTNLVLVPWFAGHGKDTSPTSVEA